MKLLLESFVALHLVFLLTHVLSQEITVSSFQQTCRNEGQLFDPIGKSFSQRTLFLTWQPHLLVGCYSCSDNQSPLFEPGIGTFALYWLTLLESCECRQGWLKVVETRLPNVNPVSCSPCPGTSVSHPMSITQTQTSSSDRLTCIECPGAMDATDTYKACVCPVGTILNYTAAPMLATVPMGECSLCESGYYPNSDISACVPCAEPKLMTAVPIFGALDNVTAGPDSSSILGYTCNCRTDLGFAETPVSAPISDIVTP